MACSRWVVQPDDLVDLAWADRAVGDEQDGPAFGGHHEVAGQLVGGVFVEMLGGLVQDDDGEVSTLTPGLPDSGISI